MTHSILVLRTCFLPPSPPEQLCSSSQAPTFRLWPALVREIWRKTNSISGPRKEDRRPLLRAAGWQLLSSQHPLEQSYPEGSLRRPALFGLGGLAPEANSRGYRSTNSCTELMRPRSSCRDAPWRPGPVETGLSAYKAVRGQACPCVQGCEGTAWFVTGLRVCSRL